jgi:hypothetical protein
VSDDACLIERLTLKRQFLFPPNTVSEKKEGSLKRKINQGAHVHVRAHAHMWDPQMGVDRSGVRGSLETTPYRGLCSLAWPGTVAKGRKSHESCGWGSSLGLLYCTDEEKSVSRLKKVQFLEKSRAVHVRARKPDPHLKNQSFV